MRDVRLIVAGFGVMGKGLAETLIEKKKILREMGFRMKVVAVCEKNGSVVNQDGIDLREALNHGLASLQGWCRKKTLDVIGDVDADILVELTPGSIRDGGQGLKHMKKALKSGKHVVTSNKSPLVVAYDSLMKLAREKGLELRFEATVCGAIPLIGVCRNELTVNSIRNMYGIFNGTTNYILSKMTEEGVEFDTALNGAQTLGYAEPNHEYDVKGIDSAAKVVILANSLLGIPVSYSDVSVTGIEEISSEAVELAKSHGYVIKLIGDVVGLKVSPMLIPMDHPLNVGGTLNSILIETDVAGEITLVGAGAGARETSSALLSDLLALSRRL